MGGAANRLMGMGLWEFPSGVQGQNPGGDLGAKPLQKLKSNV